MYVGSGELTMSGSGEPCRPPTASRCCARKLAAHSFPRKGVRSELASAATTGGGGPARLPRPVHRPCERSNDWRRGAASSPDPYIVLASGGTTGGGGPARLPRPGCVLTRPKAAQEPGCKLPDP